MSENHNILIVYSEKDDQSTDGKKGWVTHFYKFLSTLFYQITREEPLITLVNENDFRPAHLDEATVVITVLTQNLAEHSEITTAIDSFCRELKEANQLVVDGISRLFKVLISPFDADDVLPELEDFLTYDFYLIDPLTGDPQVFTMFFGSDAERGYWMKLVDMAYDINHVMHAKHLVDSKGTLLITPREKTVYLASTGVDMVIQRDIIKRELIRHGYKVLPNHSLPKEARALERMVRDDLHRCRLSIHLVGEDYGYRPKGTDLSVVDIQNRLASEHTHQSVDQNKGLSNTDKRLFSRLIWVSPDLKNITERQKIFIEDLKSDAASLEEAEVLQIHLQELKTIIRQELITGGRFQSKHHVNGIDYKETKEEAKVIYLMADRRDMHGIEPIQLYLQKEGYTVIAPSYEGDLVDLRYIHQENLRKCDATIIYFGLSSADWIRTKLQDLLKAPGFGREKPLLANAVYTPKKREVNLGQFQQPETMILGNSSAFSPEQLQPFLKKIESQ